MKLARTARPCLAVLFAASLAAHAQERTREERPAENPRPPRGEFRPGENPRGDGRGDERRREDVRRDDAPRGEARGGDFQRGPVNPPFSQQFNPQELFRDLNDDQRAALRGFFEANQNVMRETGERTMRLRREVAEAAMGDKPDEQAIREKIMQAAQLEAEATIVRARAFAQVRERLPKEVVERLRGMIAGMAGSRPGFQPPMQPPGGRNDAEIRRQAQDNFNPPPGRGAPDGARRFDGNNNDRRPAEGDLRRAPALRDGDRGPRVEGERGQPRPDGDRGQRPDGDRGERRNPEGGDRGRNVDGGERGRGPDNGDRRPELPRRPPTDQ